VHIVAARLGKTPTTVLNNYAHLLPQSDEIAAERVATALTAGEQMNNPPSQTLLDRIQRWAAGREVLLVVIKGPRNPQAQPQGSAGPPLRAP
jgi:hypothetical protein